MKKKILLVDDEIGFTRLLKLNLEQTNQYEVRVENWPEDALRAAQEFQPDAILLDVMMPRVFGGDIAAAIRADPKLQAIPIIFLTAAVRKPRVDEHAGFISGFPLLAKPASTQEVIQALESQFNPQQPKADHEKETNPGH
jgi:CheY-like chemotaxis protein